MILHHVVRLVAGVSFALAYLTVFAGGVASAKLDLKGAAPPGGGIWLETLHLTNMTTGFGRAAAMTTVAGNPISIGGVEFLHGVGTHANSELTVELKGNGLRFVADVGVDDDLKCLESQKATTTPGVEFSVWLDGKKAAVSGAMRFGQAPVRVDVDLKGARTLRLLVEKLPESRWNHVSWAGAAVMMAPGAAPPRTLAPRNKLVTPPPAAAAFTPLSPVEEAQVRTDKGDAAVLWLDDLDLGKGRTNAGNLWLGGIVSQAPRNLKPLRGRTTSEGKPLRFGAVTYPRGIVSAGENELRIDLGDAARRFVARVGFDNNRGCGKVSSSGKALFEVWVDGRPVVQTPFLHGYDRPRDISVDLTGAKLLVLNATSDGGDALWAGAFLQLDPAATTRPRTVAAPPPAPAVIAKRNPDEVRINGARVVGATPGRPFLFMIPATGKPPLRFEAAPLPSGLSLDARTGVISGAMKRSGATRLMVKVIAANGEAQRPLTIVAGRDKLALTPPMGWNSWNAWGMDVNDARIRSAADAMVSSRLAGFGFQYVNLDEGWSGERDAAGNLNPNKKFPDMTALAAYVHSKGLKFGIHSSPGPQTCGRSVGSYQHEVKDARMWAAWGIDYLKHDWCSYGSIAKSNALVELQKPYKIMRAALDATGRDFVFSLCQYGMGNVWNWGNDVGGDLWRTGSDITDTWASLSELGFTQAGREGGAGPGGWNDPDMMILGKVGWSDNLHNTRLAPNEQVTHVTLWAMLAAPLLLGNDLAQLDDFTLDLLQNPEVLDVDQDPLGRPAGRKAKNGAIELWARPLFDGTTAVALFNRGQLPADGTARWAEVGLRGAQPVRNLWLRQDLGVHKDSLTVNVPAHGAVLLRIGIPKEQQ